MFFSWLFPKVEDRRIDNYFSARGLSSSFSCRWLLHTSMVLFPGWWELMRLSQICVLEWVLSTLSYSHIPFTILGCFMFTPVLGTTFNIKKSYFRRQIYANTVRNKAMFAITSSAYWYKLKAVCKYQELCMRINIKQSAYTLSTFLYACHMLEPHFHSFRIIYGCRTFFRVLLM